MLYVIKASNRISDLTGTGLEYLTDDTGEIVRAAFFDGSFQWGAPAADASELDRDTIPAVA